MRLIDADSLIEAIRHDVEQTPNSDWGYGLNHAIPIVRNQPTVNAVPVKEQQPKTGHWVHEQINSYTSSTTCSECGGSAPFVFASDDHYGRNGYGKTELTKYCPNCGAKMET